MTTNEFKQEVVSISKTCSPKGAVFYEDPYSGKIVRITEMSVDKLGNLILKTSI